MRQPHDDQVDVRFYEQDEQGPNAKRRRVEDDQYLEELAGDEEDFNKGLKDLEHDLESFSLPKDANDDPAVEGFFSQEERLRGQAAIIANLKANGGFPHRIRLPENASVASRVFAEKINQCLDEASLDPGNEQARKDLWRFYERSKIYIPDFLKLLPDPAWDLIWSSQAEISETNPSRASHLRRLSEDMVKAGRILDESQRFGKLEGMVLEGNTEEALQEWERAREAGDAGNPNFLEMGIRMYTYAGKLQRAEELLDVLFKLHSSWNPRIIMPVISASINTGGQEGVERAWSLYKTLKGRLSTSMTIEDFDDISMDFLHNEHKEHALAIFRDMMLFAELSEKQSQSLLQKMSQRLGTFLDRSGNADEANALSLQSISYLPRSYQNKFFYAKWLKRLIGMGELDSAAKVIELMYERGIKPDAKHLNGLVGAWLRSGVPTARDRARQMAWNMIEERLEHVQRRTAASKAAADIQRARVRVGAKDTKTVARDRKTPAATIETFCILLESYVRTGTADQVRQLRQLLEPAQLKMNSVFLNQILYHTATLHGSHEVWRQFLAHSATVTPDIESWICIWECMKSELRLTSNLNTWLTKPLVQTGPSVDHTFPTPRSLLRRMLSWHASLRGQDATNAHADMENDTYNDILRCFLMTRDLSGAYAALHALTRTLDVWPNSKTARMMVLQIAHMSTERSRRNRRLTKAPKADMEDKMGRTTAVLELVTQHRRQELLRSTGKTFEDLDELGQAEESLRSLLQFLWTLVKRREEVPEESVRRAAEDMGIVGLNGEGVRRCMDIWDPDKGR